MKKFGKLGMEKIKRNDPCWCGSGLKYKYCHLDRQKQEPIPRYQAYKAYRNFLKRGFCLHPDANENNCKNIIKSHSIQKSKGLELIQKNGHVLTVLADISEEYMDGRFSNIPKKIGVNLASTFKGFCSYHDDKLFASIEKSSFKLNEENIFLLSYRALCKEIFIKKAVDEYIPYIKQADRGKSINEQIIIQNAMFNYESGILNSLKNLEFIKEMCDKILIAKSYSCLNYYAIRIDQNPEILCSSIFQPEYDFYGNFLQNINELGKLLDWFTFTIIPIKTEGLIVFSWINDMEKTEKFISSLDRFSDARICDAVVRFAFTAFENIFFSPIWWNELSAEKKQSILDRVHVIAPGILNRSAILEDNMNFVTWNVLERINKFK